MIKPEVHRRFAFRKRFRHADRCSAGKRNGLGAGYDRGSVNIAVGFKVEGNTGFSVHRIPRRADIGACRQRPGRGKRVTVLYLDIQGDIRGQLVPAGLGKRQLQRRSRRGKAQHCSQNDQKNLAFHPVTSS